MTKSKINEVVEVDTESKLRQLYELQKIDSEIDRILKLRGDLPLEVQDLEDEIAQLETRIENTQAEVGEMASMAAKKKNDIETSKTLIQKYKEQQDNVRNNREFDSLSKEIEFQTLEIELSEKKLKEFTFFAEEKKMQVSDITALLEDKQLSMAAKRKELEDITNETKREEEELRKQAEVYKGKINERLYTAYERLRSNARNGLAVVPVLRDACGGCFNKIPPQRQADIQLSKKIIVCEYCGRILINNDITIEEEN
ncbi:MAG: zinc ribbon domain-containing protein [Bacteroidales bacterium]